jgi:hypothetical protein
MEKAKIEAKTDINKINPLSVPFLWKTFRKQHLPDRCGSGGRGGESLLLRVILTNC